LPFFSYEPRSITIISLSRKYDPLPDPVNLYFIVNVLEPAVNVVNLDALDCLASPLESGYVEKTATASAAAIVVAPLTA
jgi:hypothetical protein